MKRRLAFLVGGSLALWLALVYPAYLKGGACAIEYSAVAAALCLLPTLITLGWSTAAGPRSPEQQLLIVLGGTGVRMAWVLGSGLLLYLLVEDFQRQGFWLCLLVFYLFTLALEMVLVLAAGRAAGDSTAAPGAERSGSLKSQEAPAG